MRVATWNINGVKARMPYFVRWLDELEPDLVGVQEIKSTDEQFPRDELVARGYNCEVHGQKAWNGVAVFSRQPIAVVRAGLPDQEALGARLLSVEVAGLQFTTVYVPNGKSKAHPDFEGKLGWLDSLVRFMRQRPDGPHILCGDFNVVPAAIDSWSEERMTDSIFHSADERARLSGLISSGLVDLFRAKNPEEPGFTWWDYRQGAFHKRQGLRIDLVLATEDLADRTQSVTADRRFRKKIDGLISSDHLPVVVDLDL